MMDRDAFHRELSRLYAEASLKGYVTDDFARWTKTSRTTVIRWLGGYSSPAPGGRASILAVIRKGLES